VLLLDEPTNHLDLEMREVLAETLSDFEGAIVMVSHDRHLIGLVCDTFWRVADGVIEPFAGDLDEYAAWLRSHPAVQGTKQKMAEVAPTPPPPVKPLPAKKPPNSHKLATAEKRVGELEAALAELDRQLALRRCREDGGAGPRPRCHRAAAGAGRAGLDGVDRGRLASCAYIASPAAAGSGGACVFPFMRAPISLCRR